MTWWNPKSKPEDEVDSVCLGELKPGQFVPCEEEALFRKVQSGYEWFEWFHGGKGVPWRINTEEFNQMLMDGWEIVDICSSFTLLKRPTFVHYLDTPKTTRRKKS